VAIARIIETRITPAEYDQMRVLLGIGDTPPPGGLFHVAAIGEDGGLRIIEVWDSREEAEAWGEKVMAAREEDRSRQRPAGDRVPRDSQRRSALAGRSALALREPTGRVEALCPRTITAGQVAWWAHCTLAEPSRRSAKPPCPREPSISNSALYAAASSAGTGSSSTVDCVISTSPTSPTTSRTRSASHSSRS
jgi:hypothetical protein